MLCTLYPSVFEVIVPIICSIQINMKALDNSTQVMVFHSEILQCECVSQLTITILYGIARLIINERKSTYAHLKNRESGVKFSITPRALSTVRVKNSRCGLGTRLIACIFSFLLNPLHSSKHQPLQRPHPTLSGIRLHNPISKFGQTIGGLVRCQPKGVKALAF